MALPAGFTRKDDKKYEEVTVPAMERGSSPKTKKKRTPFQRIAGAGQINVGMLCIRQAVQPHSEGGRIKKDQ